MGTALAVQDAPRETLAGYLATINSPAAIEGQKQLAAAYDAACAALVGPNDVQQEGGRSFKKKSAWRKLARHFRISVECELSDTRVETTPDGFVAYARARGVAPWGQSWADVGACASDEATGRRVITIADAIATAMTRASNRAVSNLVAMGEVSAEEIGNRQATNQPMSQRASGTPKADADKAWPFGDKKGTRLGDFPRDELEKMLKWCREKKKLDIADAIANVLNDLVLGGSPEAEPDEDDDLPF